VDPPTKFLASLHGEGGKGVGAFANSRWPLAYCVYNLPIVYIPQGCKQRVFQIFSLGTKWYKFALWTSSLL